MSKANQVLRWLRSQLRWAYGQCRHTGCGVGIAVLAQPASFAAGRLGMSVKEEPTGAALFAVATAAARTQIIAITSSAA